MLPWWWPPVSALGAASLPPRASPSKWYGVPKLGGEASHPITCSNICTKTPLKNSQLKPHQKTSFDFIAAGMLNIKPLARSHSMCPTDNHRSDVNGIANEHAVRKWKYGTPCKLSAMIGAINTVEPRD